MENILHSIAKSFGNVYLNCPITHLLTVIIALIEHNINLLIFFFSTFYIVISIIIYQLGKLMEKDTVHNCTQSYSQTFRIVDPVLRKSLKRIVSYLCHWSPILTISFRTTDDEPHFLPSFVFPFVKFNSNNLLVCFEIIATILLNQCSLWFELSPLLPLNYLGIIENLIQHFEPTLMQFYRKHSITSAIYAWKLLENAFSEVLVEFQWYQLWDHIISNPSSFMAFAVVAFNCIQRSVIVERLSNAKEIEAFFEEPTNIDMKQWLRITYKLTNDCPTDLHPKQYMRDFICLGTDNSQNRTIFNYPRKIFDRRSKHKMQMQQQMKLIHDKYLELEKFETKLMQQMVNSAKAEEHCRRMQQIDLAEEVALMHQLNRVENQRQHLILTERQLSDREFMIKMIIKDNEMRNVVNKREFQLKTDLCDLNKQVSTVTGKDLLYYYCFINFLNSNSNFLKFFTEIIR